MKHNKLLAYIDNCWLIDTSFSLKDSINIQISELCSGIRLNAQDLKNFCHISLCPLAQASYIYISSLLLIFLTFSLGQEGSCTLTLDKAPIKQDSKSWRELYLQSSNYSFFSDLLSDLCQSPRADGTIHCCSHSCHSGVVVKTLC